jgi:beta-fructofuranosidase
MAVGGHFERERFVPTASGRLDLGRRWYAPQSFDAPDGRRVCFGWLREREDELPLEARGRVGVMSLPRQLLVGEDGSLGMAPVMELQGLRRAPLAPLPHPGPEGVLALEAGRALSACEVEVTASGAGPVVVDLLDDDGQPLLQVCAHGDEIDISAPKGPSQTIGEPGPSQVRIFYDDGICEVFTGVGQVRTEIFYDLRPVRRVAVRETRAEGVTGDASLLVVKAWELANIWEDGEPDD